MQAAARACLFARQVQMSLVTLCQGSVITAAVRGVEFSAYTVLLSSLPCVSFIYSLHMYPFYGQDMDPFLSSATVHCC
jgi:hypothetical protein